MQKLQRQVILVLGKKILRKIIIFTCLYWWTNFKKCIRSRWFDGKMVDEATSLTINFDSVLYYDREAIKEISFYELGFNEAKKFIATKMFKKI